MNTLDDLDIEVVVEDGGQDVPVSKLEAEIALSPDELVEVPQGAYELNIKGKKHLLYQDMTTDDQLNLGKMVLQGPDGKKNYDSIDLGRAILTYVNDCEKTGKDIPSNVGRAILHVGDDVLFGSRMKRGIEQVKSVSTADKSKPFMTIALEYLKNPCYNQMKTLCEQYGVSRVAVEDTAKEWLQKWSVQFRQKVANMSGVHDKELIELYHTQKEL